MFNRLFLFVFPLTVTFLSAQSLAVKRITINEGLSQNYIFSMLQDSKGFLWFGTKDGLNRYDGYAFKVYRKDNAYPLSLADNNVTAIEEESDHLLWIGTANGGLLRFNRLTEQFHRYLHNPDDVNSISSDRISVVKRTAKGTYLIGTVDGGVNIFNPNDGRWRSFRHDPSNSASLCDDHVIDATEDSHGNIWVSGNGVSIIDSSGGMKRVVADSFEDLLRQTGNLYCDSKGRIWISGRNGLLMFDGSKFHAIYRADDVNQWYWTGAIREDARGSFWTIGVHHVLFINGETLVPEVKGHFPGERMSGGLLIDRSDNIWIGTGGWGLIQYNPRMHKFGRRSGNFLEEILPSEFSINRKYINDRTFDFTLRGNEFRLPFKDNAGNLFIPATAGYVYKIDTAHTMTRHDLVPDQFSARTQYNASLIFQDKRGTVWINRNNGIVRFTNAPKLNEFVVLYPDSAQQNPQTGYSDITAYCVGSDGTLWFGTPLLGLLEYHPDTKTRQWYTFQEKDTTSLSHNHVLSIIEDPYDPERFLWIGTEGGGLNKFDRQAKKFFSITERQGLPNNTVYGMLVDDENMVWLSTNKGLVKFNPKDYSMRRFDVHDGLQSNEFNRKEFYKASDGKLYFGGVNGYNAFYPHDISINSTPPDVVLTDLRLSNRSVSFVNDTSILNMPIEFTRAITLEYGANVITVEFAALEYSAPEKNQYQYTLEGFHEHWIKNGTSRTATFTNIDPGEYVLKIRGSNGDGIWNTNVTALFITILPPFWMTWWFRGILALIIVSVAPSMYYLRVRQLRREQKFREKISHMIVLNQEEERKRIAQEMHDLLGQELLVIKNRALMGLKSAPQNSIERSQLEHISISASNILTTVREISHDLRPPELDRLGLTETLRTIVAKVKDTSSFSITGAIDMIDGLIEKKNEINVVRIVQEALSNVVKYSDAKQVVVEINRDERMIGMRVQDDGKGFDTVAVPPGMGIAGISERVRMMSGTLSVTSEPGKGTTLSMNIPVHRA